MNVQAKNTEVSEVVGVLRIPQHPTFSDENPSNGDMRDQRHTRRQEDRGSVSCSTLGNLVSFVP